MDKIYGPYKRKDGRSIIIVNGKTISYPKYLYEKHHGVKVEEPWTVDHIDDDFTNNAIDNLQLLKRKDNIRKSAPGITRRTYQCHWCKKYYVKGTSYKVIPGRNTYCSYVCSHNGRF